MKKLFALFAFLSLAFAGYAASGQGAAEGRAGIEPRKIYICLVTSSTGTEVIATQVNGDYYAQVVLQNSIQFAYSSQSHPNTSFYSIERGHSSSGKIEKWEYTYGASIDVFSSDPNILPGRSIDMP